MIERSVSRLSTKILNQKLIMKKVQFVPEKNLVFEKKGISLLASTTDDDADAMDGTIYTMRMNRGPNVVNPEYVDALSDVIDQFETMDHPKSLILTGGGGRNGESTSKFFSNGLDLSFLQKSNEYEKGKLIESFWKQILGRVLIMNCRTVAVINGHAFGAGLFLALACDYRIMRTQRGYLCWPEVNLGMRLAKGFSELTKAKVTDPQTLRDGVLTAKRYGSTDAYRAGIIDDEYSIDELQYRGELLAKAGLPKNLQLQNFNPTTFQQVKIELYSDAYRALTLAKYNSPPESRL